MTSRPEVRPPRGDWTGAGFETRQIHAGELQDDPSGARITPVYLTGAYRFDSFDHAHERFAGIEEGPVYSRHGNPTNGVAERRVADLEGGSGAVLVASGTAAIATTMLALAGSGERIVSQSSIYSGTRLLFERTLARAGVATDWVWEPRDAAAWEEAITPATRAVFIETIPNPKGDLADIGLVTRVAEQHGLPVVVDNTVATPAVFRPIEHGAHIVVHSSTKYLSGHGAALSGVVVDGGVFDWSAAADRYPLLARSRTAEAPSFLDRFGRSRAFEGYLRFTTVTDLGPAPSPWHGFLLQQGMETLSLRMERHLANARAVAEYLDGHPRVAAVDYAGLPSHPDHDLAVRHLGGEGGPVFSFTVRGGADGARRVFDTLTVFSRMTNIGDVRSMVLHPATTTHGSFDDETNRRLGVEPGMLRLSIGLETVGDLIADLAAALDAA
ncbi:O-acetylhomoserine aminocarboxypropyltransferase/cysteine synthase family protein [uncultured Amnibacterium sp.]|uniref:O-acetylhomoserine aminocarboxypropyltransferase/cysteine synthase family protein n=1 Tax=uncultured Amnibacterium sp. TaxID=1631851 RepID=UPI0035CA2203